MNALSQIQPAPVIPAHVPADRVSMRDPFTDPAANADPYAYTAEIHKERPLIWSPYFNRKNGGWVVTRADLMRDILSNPALFSSKDQSGFALLLGEHWSMTPLEVDPPMHAKFRELLNPILYPRVVAQMTEGVRARADELIDDFADKGGCEFMRAFGTPFPISIFMQLMGLPAEHMGTFLVWEEDLLRGATLQRRVAAAKSIRLYLDTLAAERRKAPKQDLASLVVTSTIEGRAWTDDEVIGALFLFFVGGLDTVASSLGFFFEYLATHPEQQQYLRENLEEIPHAVEELLRRFSVVTVHRQAKADVELDGVLVKQGDWISLPQSLGSLDPDAFENPLEVDFKRKQNRHFAFSFGPHFCIGSHLARREMAVALRQWLTRIPPFRVREGSDTVRHAGGVYGIEHLELAWN